MKIAMDTSFLILALASMVCMCSSIFLRKDNDDEDTSSLLLKPKTFSIFSRPDPHADKNSAPGLISHLGSVLHGGSIGIQLEHRPLGLVHHILGHAKKIIPGSKDTVGHPIHEEPPVKDHWDEKQDWEMQKPKKEAHKEWKPEEKPGQYKPDKPVAPSWDEIGEDPEEYSSDDHGEGVIQPRYRPKRFIESKIYHVPLIYRSNARPYLVKIKSRNDMDESKHESN